ncbi:RNA polymerase sigma-70 factor [Agromyces silvae]|uniref:RNA polymerase sigma-70 factor n=1 Tax=Agromyces silvae TaxID=3388266 RepID=UPI00280A6051|nr:RNA polymerase sigma-70 factor [Agromyces protaetiae]
MSEDAFVTHRNLLFTVAYEMLGSATDAEDVLQESWLRWADVSADASHEAIRDPRAYLVRIVTRQSLNHLRTVSRRREEYVGEWLPEPLLTSPDVADDVVLAESLSMATMTVLETLGPTERAVFVLREVFDVPYEEIASAVGKSLPAVRQIAHRAKEHVAARRPRVRVERDEQEEVLARFLDAFNSGDLQRLMDVLAPDVVAIADGGGQVRGAARRPIVGAEKIVAYLRGSIEKYGVKPHLTLAWVNGALGAQLDVDGELLGVVSVTIEGGRVTRIYSVANPQKLVGLDGQTAHLASR